MTATDTIDFDRDRKAAQFAYELELDVDTADKFFRGIGASAWALQRYGVLCDWDDDDSATTCPAWCDGTPDDDHHAEANRGDEMRHRNHPTTIQAASNGPVRVHLEKPINRETAWEGQPDRLEVGGTYVLLLTADDRPVHLTPDQAQRLGAVLRGLGKEASAAQ